MESLSREAVTKLDRLLDLALLSRAERAVFLEEIARIVRDEVARKKCEAEKHKSGDGLVERTTPFRRTTP